MQDRAVSDYWRQHDTSCGVPLNAKQLEQFHGPVPGLPIALGGGNT